MPDQGTSAGCMIFENKGKVVKHRCTLEFVVDDVSSKKKNTHIDYKLLPFTSLGIKEERSEGGTGLTGASWVFLVRFGGHGSDENATKQIEAVLSIVGARKLQVNASYTFSMFNMNGIEMSRIGAEKLIEFVAANEGRQSLLTYAELLENPLFIEDSLRFRADIEFCILTESAIPKMCTPSDLAARSTSAMFNSPKCSDFKLQSNDGKIFHVHKVILTFRSDVFAAMFDHKLKETETGECVVQDVDGETLEALLKFLYGLNEWKPQLAEKLIVAADKYRILDLVDGCAQELSNSLTAKNVARILQLADEISVGKLKAAALSFIVSDLDGFNDAGGFLELAGNIGLLQELKGSGSQTRKLKRQKTTA